MINPDSHLIGKRISIARTEKGITAKELADAISVAASTISRYEKGEIVKVKMPVIEAIARVLNVNPMWLVGKSEYKKVKDMLNAWKTEPPKGTFKPEMKKVPMLGYAAAGQPLENLDGQDTYYVQVDGTQKVDFCITVRGDSMIGAGINDGDIVFVHQQPTIENGQVGCFEIDRNRVCLKRFYKTADGVMLVSENPKYAPMMFTADNCEDFKVLGLAVIKQSNIK
jgi:repressor LexA